MTDEEYGCLVLTGYRFKTGMTNSPRRAKPKTKKNDDINYWLLAFASMTRTLGWIPICTGMTVLGFGFLRRSTDYIHVVEDRYDELATKSR